MSQYSTGTVSTTAASATVTGVGTLWLANVSAGDEILIGDDPVFYIVGSVGSDTSLTLTANYPATLATQDYIINSDFTTYLNIPIVNQGDLNFANTFTRAVEVLDAAYNAHIETATTIPRGIMSKQVSADNSPARIQGYKARGTTATPAIIVTNDGLLRLRAAGYDGAAYKEMGGIDILAVGTIGTDRVPTEMQFFTATDAATSVLTKALTIDKAGNILIHVGKITTYNGIATEGHGIPAIVDSVSLGLQQTSLGPTTCSNTSVLGRYRVSYYLVGVTADTTYAPTVQLSIIWTDDAGVERTYASTDISIDDLAYTQGVVICSVPSGGVAWKTVVTGTVDDGTYAIGLTVERLA